MLRVTLTKVVWRLTLECFVNALDCLAQFSKGFSLHLISTGIQGIQKAAAELHD
jgi:hypothetical protein